MKRTFLLPLLSVTSLTATACGSSIAGDWDLTQVIYDGSVNNLPSSERGFREGLIYTLGYAAGMSLDEDGTGTLIQTYTYPYNSPYDEVCTDRYAGTWAKNDDKTFDLSFSEKNLDLSCTLERGDLECNDGKGQDSIFSRAD